MKVNFTAEALRREEDLTHHRDNETQRNSAVGVDL